MEMVNVSLQILPRVPEEKLYPVVDKVIEYIKSTGVNHVVGPMETTMEGSYDELMDIVKVAQKICFDEGANRVLAVVKIDNKRGGIKMEEKIGKYK